MGRGGVLTHSSTARFVWRQRRRRRWRWRASVEALELALSGSCCQIEEGAAQRRLSAGRGGQGRDFSLAADLLATRDGQLQLTQLLWSLQQYSVLLSHGLTPTTDPCSERRHLRLPPAMPLSRPSSQPRPRLPKQLQQCKYPGTCLALDVCAMSSTSVTVQSLKCLGLRTELDGHQRQILVMMKAVSLVPRCLQERKNDDRTTLIATGSGGQALIYPFSCQKTRPPR